MFFIALGLIFGFIIRLPLLLMKSSDRLSGFTRIKWQKNSKWITHELPDSLIKGSSPRPVLVPYIISRLPERIWYPATVFFNIIPDLIVSVLVYISVFYLLDNNSILEISKIREISFMAMLLFLTQPILLPVNARMKACNGRAQGILLITVYHIFIYLFFEYGSIYWFMAAFITAILTFITSIFAAQALVFFSIPSAIMYGNTYPLLVPALVILIGYTSNLLGIRDILDYKIHHAIWYLRFRKKGTTSANRNLLKNVLMLPYYIFTDPKRAYRIVISDSPLIILSYSLPLIFLFFSVIGSNDIRAYLLSNPIMKFCLIFIFSSLTAFLITSVSVFTIFGQAERYFEYTSPMIIVVAIVGSIGFSTITTYHLIYFLILQLTVLVFIHIASDPKNIAGYLKKPSTSNDELELIDYLKNINDGLRVATLPIKLSIFLSFSTSDNLSDKLEYYYPNILIKNSKFDGFKSQGDDLEIHDHFRGVPEALSEKYGINYIIAMNKTLDQYKESEFVAALTKKSPEFKSKKYTVFKLSV